MKRFLGRATCVATTRMKFITEAEHVHSSSEQYRDEFEQLKIRLGIDSNYN